MNLPVREFYPLAVPSQITHLSLELSEFFCDVVQRQRQICDGWWPLQTLLKFIGSRLNPCDLTINILVGCTKLLVQQLIRNLHTAKPKQSYRSFWWSHKPLPLLLRSDFVSRRSLYIRKTKPVWDNWNISRYCHIPKNNRYKRSYKVIMLLYTS